MFEIGEHLPIEVVELGDLWIRPRVNVTLRRRLAIFVIEVPASADRFTIMVHQVAEPGPLPAVEVLQLEALPSGRPVGEFVVVAEELVGTHDRDVEAAEEFKAVPARWFGGGDRVGGELCDVLEKAGAQRVGVAVVDVEAGVGELDRETSHCSDHEVGALAVPPFRGELAE